MKRKAILLKREVGKDWLKVAESMLKQCWFETDKNIKLMAQEAVSNRSEAQNRLMWRWHSELVAYILESTGNTFSSEDLHEYVVDKLLPKRVITISNEPIIIRTSTRKLSTTDFSEFLLKYDVWANDTYQCKFTHPDDLYHMAVMNDEK